MRKLTTTALATLFLLGGTAYSMADIIEGNWRTKSGETAAIAKCGSAFCITLKTGTYAGKRIGRLSGSNGSYEGTITDPEDDKQYSGSADVKGKSMKLKGCALRVFCQTQNWKKL